MDEGQQDIRFKLFLLFPHTENPATFQGLSSPGSLSIPAPEWAGTGCADWVSWSSLLRAVLRKDRFHSLIGGHLCISVTIINSAVLLVVFLQSSKFIFPFTKSRHRVIRREAAAPVLMTSGREECVFYCPGRVRSGLEVAQIVNRDIGAWLPPHFTTQRIWLRSPISSGQLPIAFIHLPPQTMT